jgi:hypothetical protein
MLFTKIKHWTVFYDVTRVVWDIGKNVLQAPASSVVSHAEGGVTIYPEMLVLDAS